MGAGIPNYFHADRDELRIIGILVNRELLQDLPLIPGILNPDYPLLLAWDEIAGSSFWGFGDCDGRRPEASSTNSMNYEVHPFLGIEMPN